MGKRSTLGIGTTHWPPIIVTPNAFSQLGAFVCEGHHDIHKVMRLERDHVCTFSQTRSEMRFSFAATRSVAAGAQGKPNGSASGRMWTNLPPVVESDRRSW
jgi:hypothetical protein